MLQAKRKGEGKQCPFFKPGVASEAGGRSMMCTGTGRTEMQGYKDAGRKKEQEEEGAWAKDDARLLTVHPSKINCYEASRRAL